MGPMFRHEKPQKGRYRQFTQLGLEALGFETPYIDAEMIAMTFELWRELGLTDFELQVNTLGTAQERLIYRQELIAYLEKYQSYLDEDGLRRLYKNPLRVLDSKTEAMQEICNGAPKLMEYLTESSLKHYETWCDQLRALNIPFVENSRLVRGLDYYNHSVFEWVTNTAENPLTFCAGGRYNGLTEELGGEPVSGIGFAIGLERLLAMVNLPLEDEKSLIYIAHLGQGTEQRALQLASELRGLGLNVKIDFEQTSFKAQLKRANNQGTRVVIIIGEEEVSRNVVQIKDMLNNQEYRDVADYKAILQDLLSC